jgi:lantibiotic modifying enzyme
MSQGSPEFLATADVIGARLCRDAIWAGPRCNWIGSSMEFVERSWRPVHRSFGAEVYNGTSGIALFLHRLFALTQVSDYRRCATGALEQSLSRSSEFPSTTRAGFYSGLTGVAFVAFELGRADVALRLLKTLLDDDSQDQDLDVISGSAGAIPALLAIHQRCGEDFLVELAVRHGEHILQTARQNGDAWSWNTLRLAAGHDLTGFSHGTSGIAWALLELFRKTGEFNYKRAALNAFAYERQCFSLQHGNWPDFRSLNEQNPPGSGEPSYAMAWCHGAPGIGLSRLRAYTILKEDWCRDEAEVALRTTLPYLREPLLRSQNFSLCHGLGGNCELALYAAQVLGDENARLAAEQVGWYGIEAFRRTAAPWPCGVLDAGETPNLMLGLAGIGYFYLRLHDLEGVRSALMVLPA